jgi:hypothetical protein
MHTLQKIMKVSVLRRSRLFLSLPDPDHETKIVRKPLHTLQQIMKVSQNILVTVRPCLTLMRQCSDASTLATVRILIWGSAGIFRTSCGSGPGAGSGSMVSVQYAFGPSQTVSTGTDIRIPIQLRIRILSSSKKNNI